ncbi:glycosyltransferase [Anaerophaga thermohalophila]|uniref:glycosyltransferase n=1 Tax=Anaerophaga thermohalophila TaxID=177400 RepID=UPI0002F61371|nr:glycosyl transferase family 90 [Anaerophaga thermohalophila]
MLKLTSLKSMMQKNNKFFYYSGNFMRQLLPRRLFQNKLKKKLKRLKKYWSDDVVKRVNYYNKLTPDTPIGKTSTQLRNFKYGIKPKTYFFDSFKFFRYFPDNLRISFLFGDITYTPPEPSFVKSRPVGDRNYNSVVLKLNEIRHFLFIKDSKDFDSKKNSLVWRGKVYQQKREEFLRRYFDHPMCNVGKVNSDKGDMKWLLPRMSIHEQLEYKFILCLEGNDVASNLKWVMSSNSIAVMPRPRFETWFMEGTLRGGVHYIEIREDYSDLEEKLKYYLENKDEARRIIENAHLHVEQFKNKKQEELISFLTILKYFRNTGQKIGDLDSQIANNQASADNSDLL